MIIRREWYNDFFPSPSLNYERDEKKHVEIEGTSDKFDDDMQLW